MQHQTAFVFDHPLIQHKISILRDKYTSTKEFRELVEELAMLMIYEVTKDLPLTQADIETPIGMTRASFLTNRPIALVPILRAGLGMVPGVQKLLPNAKVGHIGLYRDHDTLQPVEYYCKLPENIAESTVFVLDPMLATGASAAAAVQFLKDRGCKSLKFISIIAAQAGVDFLAKAHPDVPVYCAALDARLNDAAYIVPGLGDAGDRLFGTK